MTAYSREKRDRLFNLLPAYLRELDGLERLHPDDPPGPLQAFLSVIEMQAEALDGDIEQLLNNAFIETCEPWAIPYIGDLVAMTPLFDESRIRGGDSAAEIFSDLNGPSLRPNIGLGNRADVAKTIYYRRRKGTLPMLEEMARDVTGWPAHGVEFFQRLRWSQWIRNHIRMQALETPDLRSVVRLDTLEGAFDETCRTVDVRAIAPDEGWYGTRKIGFFLWRLKAHRFEQIDARQQGAAGDFRWRFSPLGQDAPLFSAGRREDDETGLSARHHVPQAISHATLFEDLSQSLSQPVIPDFSQYYGLFDPFPAMVLAEDRAMMIFIGGQPVPLSRIRCRNLDAWSQPATNIVSVDTATGRIALGPVAAAAGPVTVWYHHGFPGDLGGGPYRRRAWQINAPAGTQMLPVDNSGNPGTFNTINGALAQWVALGKPNCIIQIRDNRTYKEAIAIDPFDKRFIAIEASDSKCPHLLLPDPLTISGDHDSSTVTLGGLLIEGRVEITGSLGALRLIHSTLVPGESIAVPDPAVAPPPAQPTQASILAAMTRPDGSPANRKLRVEAAFCVMGPLRLPEHAQALVLLDCIVDGLDIAAVAGPAANSFGPASRIERSTLRGAMRFRQIDLASESIFDGSLTVLRQQVGCLRFSYVQDNARTPRRYRCQPSLAIRKAVDAAGPLTPAELALLRQQVAQRVAPEYVSEAYGQPAYLQLSDNGPIEIGTGSEDGAEMGVWCHLKQPQRAANLKLRLDEYLPFGLSAALIHAN
ncbi:hypothetical protein AFK24_15540 [Pseudomonas syringae]|uniref:Phage tail protein n=1 Tax=Pseudomonas syringae TaxID=317 RepID=A0A1C7Z6T1_PSESX|nr:hypothetical protein [Pseudomonas syringae]OCR24168.1 hypothetical protein AFK24_15540 [Pseudomonas syringae]